MGLSIPMRVSFGETFYDLKDILEIANDHHKPLG